jgi:hypothetical protein
VEDIDARRAEQLAYLGGDPIEEDDDLSGDRGDDVLPVVEDYDEQEEEDEEPAAEDDESDDADDSAEEDADDADEGDDAEADDSDDDDDQSDVQDDEASEEDDSDASESPDPAPRNKGIPLSRFNEVNERRKAAERELAELKAQQSATQEAQEDAFDFDAAEVEYMDLLLDGKTAEAAAKRSEIRAAEKEAFKQEAKTESLESVQENADLATLDSLSVQAEEAYPVFNEGHPDYDANIAAKVVTYMRGYMADGKTSIPDAFVSGLADVIQQYDLDTKYGETESQGDPEPDPVPPPKKGKPIKKTAEKVKLAKKQAASPASGGDSFDSAGVAARSIEDMSDKDLDNLSAKQLAIMRGDYIEED